MTQPDRREAGEQLVRDMFGEQFLAEKFTMPNASPEAATDMAVLSIEQCYGDIWTRPGLDRRSRSLVTLGVLIASGHAAELANHVLGALGNGLTPDEITEAVLHTAPYVGLPAAGQAMGTVTRTLASLAPGMSDDVGHEPGRSRSA